MDLASRSRRACKLGVTCKCLFQENFQGEGETDVINILQFNRVEDNY